MRLDKKKKTLVGKARDERLSVGKFPKNSKTFLVKRASLLLVLVSYARNKALERRLQRPRDVRPCPQCSAQASLQAPAGSTPCQRSSLTVIKLFTIVRNKLECFSSHTFQS